MTATDLKAESVSLEMATETTDDVKPIKPPRLGRGVAFGSEYGGGMSERAYIATACLQGLLADKDFNCASDKAATIAIGYADALLLELAK